MTCDVIMWAQSDVREPNICVYRLEILHDCCTARTTHCGSGYDVTIATYLIRDLYAFPKWKMHCFLLQSLTDFLVHVLVLVLYNVHICSHSLNEQEEQ